MPVQGLIVDMDGVLCRGDQPIGELRLIFEALRRKDLKFVLATNNATRSIQQFQAKLAGLNVDVSAEEIINSPVATGIYLKKRFPQGGKVFVIGESGLATTLADYGFEHSDQHAWNMLDQIIVSGSLIVSNDINYVCNSFEVFKHHLIVTRYGPYEGTPFPTYGGRKYLRGYSDHFPVTAKFRIVRSLD